MNPHPTVEFLALFSSSDLPWLDRWKIGRHVSVCEQCDRQLSLFRASRIELRRQAQSETLTGFEAIADWSRLEREMEGNIVVGLAAARCIDSGVKGRRPLVKLSLVGGLLVLFVLGWITHVPSEQSLRMYSAVQSAFSGRQTSRYSGPILRTQPDGIVVGSQESSLTILHPESAIVSFSGGAAVEARYVDDETGQVTITDVYGQ